MPFACNACGQQIAETGTQSTLPFHPCEQKQICNTHRGLQAGVRKGTDGIAASEPSLVAHDFSVGDSGDITILCQVGK